ncbi:hypothetical protein [Kitasatospora sp. NPDC085879]|uniref:hypothetical protein n=1 Tax=Kitasatospora sp. NPDC085879 TaxID=3154769 RepID=UPI00341A621A
MTALSVYDKAVQLQNRVRQIAEGEVGEKEADRVLGRVKELGVALADFRTQFGVSRELARLGAAELPDLTAVEAARTAFERKARVGLPANPVFNTARRKIEESTDTLRSANSEAWSSWASGKLAELPLARIPMLPPDDRAVARARAKELQQAIASKSLSKSTIVLFTGTYELLAESLQGKSDPPEELLSLLTRLESRPSPTLRDITDSDIALLRRFEMDTYITLQRTAA